MTHKYRFPALLAALCLMLCACHRTAPSQSPSEPAAAPGSTAPPYQIELEPTVPRQDLIFDEVKSEAVRIPFAGSANSIRYITDASQLPDNEALKKYDDAFFREHALILVTETVGSGSVQVDIASIEIDGDTATVTLTHKLPGEIGTDDMAAWLLWAEVDAGLELNWVVANHTIKPSAELS